MNDFSRNRRQIARALLIFTSAVALASVQPVGLCAESEATVAKAPELAKQIEGTWVYVGMPGAVVAPPTSGARYKTIQYGLYKVAQKDANGKVIYHHGGTYTLNGDQYAETCEYSSLEGSELVKQTYRFTIKIEGDQLVQTGVGNPYTELWKKVKESDK